LVPQISDGKKGQKFLSVTENKKPKAKHLGLKDKKI